LIFEVKIDPLYNKYYFQDSDKDSEDKVVKAEQALAESIPKVENEVEEKNVKSVDDQNVGQEKRDVVKKEETNIVAAPQQQAIPLSAKLPSNVNLQQPAGGAEQNLSAIFIGLQKLTKDFSGTV
jgi:hypothetical protein